MQGEVKLAQAPTIPDCFPNSQKVHIEVPFENDVLRVPMRRIFIKDGADYLDVPDTSGPQVLAAPSLVLLLEPTCGGVQYLCISRDQMGDKTVVGRFCA